MSHAGGRRVTASKTHSKQSEVDELVLGLHVQHPRQNRHSPSRRPKEQAASARTRIRLAGCVLIDWIKYPCATVPATALVSTHQSLAGTCNDRPGHRTSCRIARGRIPEGHRERPRAAAPQSITVRSDVWSLLDETQACRSIKFLNFVKNLGSPSEIDVEAKIELTNRLRVALPRRAWKAVCVLTAAPRHWLQD